mmetsp:Transcript_5197/g.8563  ORF Transcript_5197/g.8563 Transcript_5197/m.8563 type:complete len:401 (-) Transcript_5197:127-1329(-)
MKESNLRADISKAHDDENIFPRHALSASWLSFCPYITHLTLTKNFFHMELTMIVPRVVLAPSLRNSAPIKRLFTIAAIQRSTSSSLTSPHQPGFGLQNYRSNSASLLSTMSSKPIIHPTVESIRSVRKSIHPSTTIGFVPTMGALHEGHLSLAREARLKNDIVIASIFVNPTQFGEGEDLDKYPRQLEEDVAKLREIGVDHVFAPNADVMYGKNHVTFVEPMGFDETKEGISRPGHFRGVATVVTKLFNIVQPTNAYFGQKDAVQCIVIRRIAQDLDMDVNVQIMDTVREEDGLAMSSRNAYLTDEERERAPIVYQSLRAARELFDSRFARGEEEVNADDLREVVTNVLESEPMISTIEYVAIDDLENMRPMEKVGECGCVVSLACKLGSVRLIDNVVLR